MSYSSPESRVEIGAEQAFREAFERLKRGKPMRLVKGAPVSQNNVAKEAGRDPSALRKSRYPTLIDDIQRWIEDFALTAPPSPRQTILRKRQRNVELKKRNDEMAVQRDLALSLLVESDARVLYLTKELEHLQALAPTSEVSTLRPKGIGTK
ncbi:hypothetical protein ASD55_02220 [Rhodanobacter sp. Root561]|uniref:hypothetical protein n=1 Tax=Rhodanobacter sp. Root561 TaxID=1736560 RepID=UPI0006F887F5|nr:hypothetical protein [Rhodanobacter sp. Root561]KQZ79536.1 hypothetical protein ASD55_02220 [Rhodanobacter sp. Root561]